MTTKADRCDRPWYALYSLDSGGTWPAAYRSDVPGLESERRHATRDEAVETARGEAERQRDEEGEDDRRILYRVVRQGDDPHLQSAYRLDGTDVGTALPGQRRALAVPSVDDDYREPAPVIHAPQSLLDLGL